MIARQMRSYAWNDGKELHIGRDSLVMGVLNITDDSFSDGGKWNTLETAMKHAKDMVEDGAAIVSGVRYISKMEVTTEVKYSSTASLVSS